MSKIILKNCILAYPRLFEPAEFQKTPADSDPAKAKYSATLLIDPSTKEGEENIAKVKKAVKDIEAETWKGKTPKSIKHSCGPGSEKDNEAFEPYYVISASDKFNPVVMDRDATEITKDDHRASYLKTGTLANVILSAWGMKNSFGNRVCFNLKGVQFVKDGRLDLGGSGDVSNDFDALEVAPVEDFTEAI